MAGDIGKGDWVECCDVRQWTPGAVAQDMLVLGALYQVEEIYTDIPDALMRETEMLLLVGVRSPQINAAGRGGFYARRFRPIKGEQTKTESRATIDATSKVTV